MQSIITSMRKLLKLGRVLFLFSSLSLTGSVLAKEPDYEPLSDYHANSVFGQIGTPVGKLIITTNRGIYNCTAFLISPPYLMTNEHCVSSRIYDVKKKKWIMRQITKVHVEMNYVDPSDRSYVKDFFVQMPPLEMNATLDYAILKVEGNPAAEFGYLSLSISKPQEKTPLWIIGHPRGLAKQISRVHCRVLPYSKPHIRSLHHTCPAVPGSSGSPVFDANTSQVIALNYAGLGGTNFKIGLAVPFYHIAKQSSLLRSILKK